MSKIRMVIIGGIAVSLAFALGVGVARSQQRPPLGLLQKDLAAAARVGEEETVQLLNALGPAVTRQLAAGRQVSLPGLGTFRVVRLGETRNLDVEGKVITQPATNVVEFLPDAGMNQVANAPGAVPATVVPAFQYNPLPGQTPSQKVPYFRTPSTRVR